MQIDEAIKHCLEVAEENDKFCPTPKGTVDNHKKCACEHRQLAEWLTEYKSLKEAWGKIRNEVEELSEIDHDGDHFDDCKLDVLKIFDKHLKEVENEADN